MKVLLVWETPDGAALYLLPKTQAEKNPWLEELCGYISNCSPPDEGKEQLLHRLFDLLAPYGCLGIDGLVQDEGDWVRYEVDTRNATTINWPVKVVHCGWC